MQLGRQRVLDQFQQSGEAGLLDAGNPDFRRQDAFHFQGYNCLLYGAKFFKAPSVCLALGFFE
jgi:hypothetical protein